MIRNSHSDHIAQFGMFFSTFAHQIKLGAGMEDIVIFPSRKKLVLIAVGAFVFIAIGVFIIRKPEIFWVIRILGGYLGVAFSGACLGYALLRLTKPKPSLVINDEGVFDNASAIGAGMLKWSEIAELKIISYMGQRFLSIVPNNLEEILQRQSILKRWLMKANRGLVDSPFNVPEITLTLKLEEVLSLIDARRSGT